MLPNNLGDSENDVLNLYILPSHYFQIDIMLSLKECEEGDVIQHSKLC